MRGKSLRTKLTIGSVSMILVLLLLSGYFVWLKISAIELNNAIQSSCALTKVMIRRFEENAAAFKRQIDFMTLDGELQDLIGRLDNRDESDALVVREIRSHITMRQFSTEQTSGVFLYDADGDLITKWVKSPNVSGNYELPDTATPENYPASGRVSAYFADGHLVYGRAIRTLQDFRTVGYISFLQDDRAMKNMLRDIAEEGVGTLSLYNHTDDILIMGAGAEPEGFREALHEADMDAAADGIFLQMPDGAEALISTGQVLHEGWYLVNAMERSDIYHSRDLWVVVIAAFAAASVLISLAMQLLIERTVIRPLQKVMGAVRQVEANDYDVRLQVDTGDEIGLLADNINHMATMIDELVNQNLKSEIAHQEMQLSLLQKQIQPHFIFNTLECINGLEEMGRSEDVRTMTVDFARLLKMQMDNRAMTTIREELSCSEAYLQMQEIMLGDVLTYETHLEEDCTEVMIPRLLLQPLVENAVLHGIKKSGRKGKCSIDILDTGEGVSISVSDDGLGFDAERLSAFRAYIADGESGAEEKESHIGLKNVIDRIRYRYGERGTIEIFSDPEWGCSVEIGLPYE